MGGQGPGHSRRGREERAASDQKYRAAGVGVVPDAVVALRVGVTTNAVHQYRSRRGVSRPVCEAVTRVIAEPRAGFHVFWHRGTGQKMIRIHSESGREISISRFFVELRLGRRLRRDERLDRWGRVVRSSELFGFEVMWARRKAGLDQLD